MGSFLSPKFECTPFLGIEHPLRSVSDCSLLQAHDLGFSGTKRKSLSMSLRALF